MALSKHIEDETRIKKGFPPPTDSEKAAMKAQTESKGEERKQIKEGE